MWGVSVIRADNKVKKDELSLKPLTYLLYLLFLLCLRRLLCLRLLCLLCLLCLRRLPPFCIGADSYIAIFPPIMRGYG